MKNKKNTAKANTQNNKKGMFEPILNIFRKFLEILKPITNFFKKIFKFIGKLFEKNDLVKWVSLILIISVLFSWVFKMTLDPENVDFWRIGILDLFNIGPMGLELEQRLTITMFTFIVIVAFFYEVLGKTNQYRTMIDKITKKLSKHGLFFVLCTIFFFALISSVFTNSLIAFFFVPFFISIILGFKYDKITAFLATFGGILVGIIGNTFGGNVFGSLSSTLNVGYKEGFVLYRFILLLVSIILLTIFTLIRIKRNSNKDKDLNLKEYNELFEVEKSTKKTKTILIPILFILLSILIIMASIPWTAAFASTWPQKFLTSFEELTVFKFPLFKNLTGYVSPLGEWDLYGIQSVILITILVVALKCKLSFSDVIDAFVSAFKKIIKPLLVIFMINYVRSINAFFPIIRTVFIDLMQSFNYFIAAIFAFFASIFGVDMQITWLLFGSDMLTKFAGNINNEKMLIITQSVYGFAQFVSPTSLFLMLGLSLLDIPFIKWIKKSWPLILGLLVLVITVIILITQLY